MGIKTMKIRKKAEKDRRNKRKQRKTEGTKESRSRKYITKESILLFIPELLRQKKPKITRAGICGL